MYLLDMDAMGYEGGKSTDESQWKKEYLPAFNVSSYILEGRLHSIPKNCI
jgi:hypothetical protein